MIIKDHINMIPDHPLRGHNDERFRPRFVNIVSLTKNTNIKS